MIYIDSKHKHKTENVIKTHLFISLNKLPAMIKHNNDRIIFNNGPKLAIKHNDDPYNLIILPDQLISCPKSAVPSAVGSISCSITRLSALLFPFIL